MKALFFAGVALFLIVGMRNDGQAACNAGCQAKCRATHRGFTYEQSVAKWSKLNENPAEARRIAQWMRIPVLLLVFGDDSAFLVEPGLLA